MMGPVAHCIYLVLVFQYDNLDILMVTGKRDVMPI